MFLEESRLREYNFVILGGRKMTAPVETPLRMIRLGDLIPKETQIKVTGEN
jgi:hypothetical protein